MGAAKNNNNWAILEGEGGGSSGGNDASSSSQIPYSSSVVDTSLPLPLMIPRIIELCKDLFSNWRELDDSLFSVERVSGGITNLLLKVSVKKEDKESSITVRLYGPNTDYVINRQRELQVLLNVFLLYHLKFYLVSFWLFDSVGYQVSLCCRIWCQVAWWIWKWDGAIFYQCKNLSAIRHEAAKDCC